MGGFSPAAPDPDGRTVAAVDVSVPDEAAGRPVTVEITVPRAAVENAGVEPSALRVVRFDGGNALDRLDTDVVAAETPGSSTVAVIAPNQPAARTSTTGAASTATPEPTAGGGAGFGLVVALVALLTAAATATARRR